MINLCSSELPVESWLKKSYIAHVLHNHTDKTNLTIIGLLDVYTIFHISDIHDFCVDWNQFN